MDFTPDILVTTEDSSGVLMVVKTKLYGAESEADGAQLKQYMWHVHCPLGLLVTPDEVFVFRDTFRRDDEAAVQLTGSFPAEGLQIARNEVEFESAVQDWLERLSDSDERSPESGAIANELLPALREGVVRAAHPRLMTA